MSLIFLNNDDRDEKDVRTLVRSIAAHHSHHSGTRKPKRSKKQKSIDASGAQAGPSSSSNASSRRTSLISPTSTRSRNTIPESDEPVSAISQRSASSLLPLERPPTPTGDPFDSYPVPSQPWFAEVLHYMWPFMLRAWAPLQLGAAQESEALTWMQRTNMSSAPYFLMNMLTVMGDLISRGVMPASREVWLTAEVVAAINRSLSTQGVVPDTGTILTVGRIAFKEIMLGDVEAGIKFHRPAFARMIVMAGGIDALEQPALVKAHFYWGERLVERKTGVSIAEIEPALAADVAVAGSPNQQRDSKYTKVFDQYRPYRDREGDHMQQQQDQ